MLQNGIASSLSNIFFIRKQLQSTEDVEWISISVHNESVPEGFKFRRQGPISAHSVWLTVHVKLKVSVWVRQFLSCKTRGPMLSYSLYTKVLPVLLLFFVGAIRIDAKWIYNFLLSRLTTWRIPAEQFATQLTSFSRLEPPKYMPSSLTEYFRDLLFLGNYRYSLLNYPSQTKWVSERSKLTHVVLWKV